MSERWVWAALLRWLGWSGLYLASWATSKDVRWRTLARWVEADKVIRQHLDAPSA